MGWGTVRDYERAAEGITVLAFKLAPTVLQYGSIANAHEGTRRLNGSTQSMAQGARGWVEQLSPRVPRTMHALHGANCPTSRRDLMLLRARSLRQWRWHFHVP